ncbi:MAG: Ig domain-containing protein [Rhodospirillaceae bacterium]|nr:Ig domain-containing protein [Rhodospirillaceae bacterium]
MLLYAWGAQAERYSVPLLLPATTTDASQGVLRILNGTAESGTVSIHAIDDAGVRSGPATFTLNASAAVDFTATDLQSGNAMLGLSGGIGTDSGDARLEIHTDLRIVPLAFVRATDGTLSAMHDTVRAASPDGSGPYRYEVPVFNPSTEMTQASRLRLINPGDSSAAITISARDDSGAGAAGGEVTLTIAAGGARTLTARQLEAGDTALTGQLGAGAGKWRLTVSSDRPLQVVNIVASTAGYWNNLSTTAAGGHAPADQDTATERFDGQSIVYETDAGSFTITPMADDRFTETGESDGVTTTYMGDYSYAAIGPDAGRLTLDYEGGDRCQANLYFSTRKSGWFASHCTGSDDPDGYWIGGSWSLEDDDDGGDGAVMETAYGVDDALPGVPTSGVFIPTISDGGSLLITSSGTTITLNDGAYFELSDGTRYTCTTADGCTVVNGSVTAGSVTGRAAGSGDVDRFPTFRDATGPGDQSYNTGTAIDTLTLPEASGGNGALTYSLSPGVPGLSFNSSSRQLTGTPSTANTYAMTYTVTDEDGDTDTLSFTVTVSAGTSTAGSLGDCQVGMMLSPGQSCTYPGTTAAFSVNVRGRGSFLGRLAGIRIRINYETINDRLYDFEASHQGDGVWRIDRIAGSTEVPTNGGSDPTTGTPPDPPDPVRFDHSTAFEQLPIDSRFFREGLLDFDWYLYNYNFAKYAGYQDLLAKFDRHLPAGRGLTILQAERSHTPDSAGNVLHLFANPGTDEHSTTVANFLTERNSYPSLWTQYRTFSLYLDNFHASTTSDLRTFAAGLGSGPTYPETSYDGMALTPAKLLNVSNSNGGGAETVRQFDKFVEENDLVACTAVSGGSGGNATTSGTAYNSITVHHTQSHPSIFEGARVNDHGEPRYKPDIVTRSEFSRASSWSAPTVCSAAAMLLERTQVDPQVAGAYNSVALKAILMAGATRFNYRISAHWSDVQMVNREELISEPLFYWGEWERTSDALPMSPRHGAGALNVLAAYEILDAGEFDAGSGPVGIRGWDHAEGHSAGDTLVYPISLDRETMFSAVLVWHRYIDDDFVSHLPDYEVSVYDDADTRVAFSDSTTSNTELIEVKLAAGDYRMLVRVKSDDGSTDGLSYGLAWIGKEVLVAPANVQVSGESETDWTVSWDRQPDRKYRVSVGTDAEFSDIDREVFVVGGRYEHAVPDDGTGRHFRVYAYPEDGNVAYQYPSEPVTERSPVQHEGDGTGAALR